MAVLDILYEKLLNCKFSLYIYVTAILGPNFYFSAIENMWNSVFDVVVLSWCVLEARLMLVIIKVHCN